MNIQTINPKDNTIIHTYEMMSDHDLVDIIEQSHKVYTQWRDVPFEKRKKCMNRAAELLRKNKETYATLMANEMGKPLSQGRGEIEKCAWVCEFYAEEAEGFMKPRVIETEMKKSYVLYQPLGVVYSIMPWNFPFWQVFRCLAPTLMAGNGLLLSHAPISTGTALAIEKLIEEAGFPKGLFRALIIDYDQSAKVIAHQRIIAATLTGSERAGKAIGSEAGLSLKKAVLELGGSDPYLVLEDADLEKAADACIASRLSNCGQVCISAKRIIVLESVYDQFEKMIIERMKRFQMGDPLDEKTTLGPMARTDLRDSLHKQVQASIKEGAKLLIGGTLPEGPGAYYPPTLLSRVKQGMTAFDQELFGPVVTLICAKDEKEAVDMANDSSFGLGGGVFTQDLARGERIASLIEAGAVSVNTYVASDPRLPFGGIKRSGYGRELSIEGIHAFVNIKTICVKE